MLKKHKVVMLPTNQKAKLIMDFYGKLILFNTSQRLAHKDEGRNLYFISDEEIKGCDWQNPFWYIDFRIVNQPILSNTPIHKDKIFACKKIIATTDTSLKIGHNYGSIEYEGKVIDCNDYLPQPYQSFLEVFVREYNKGNIITEVMIDYEENGITCEAKRQGEDCYGCQRMCDWEYTYKPKVNPKDNTITITIKRVKDSWNKEEVVNLINQYEKDTFPSRYEGYPTEQREIDNWVEQNL